MASSTIPFKKDYVIGRSNATSTPYTLNIPSMQGGRGIYILGYSMGSNGNNGGKYEGYCRIGWDGSLNIDTDLSSLDITYSNYVLTVIVPAYTVLTAIKLY